MLAADLSMSCADDQPSFSSEAARSHLTAAPCLKPCKTHAVIPFRLVVRTKTYPAHAIDQRMPPPTYRT